MMLVRIWRVIVSFIYWLLGKPRSTTVPTIRPVFYGDLNRATNGLTFLIKDAGASAPTGTLNASLAINGNTATSLPCTARRRRNTIANDWIVQFPATGFPAPEPYGGGVGTVSITVNGHPLSHDVGFGEPPNAYGPCPAGVGGSEPPAGCFVKPVLRHQTPTTTGLTLLIEGYDAPPGVSATLSVKIGGVTYNPAVAPKHPPKPFTHLNPDGYFVLIDLTAGGPAGNGDGVLTVFVDAHEYQIPVGYGQTC